MNRLSKALLPGLLALLLAGFTHAQPLPTLTASQWREDLRFLQKQVHDKYSNLFFTISANQWDSAVSALDEKLAGLSDTEIKVEFVKLVALFHVGHTMVRQRLGTGENTTAWVHPIPLRFYMFSDGLYIKRAGEKYKEAVGGKISFIGNTPVKEVLEKIRPTLSFENEQGFKNMLQHFLNLPEYLKATGIITETSKIPVTYIKKGVEKTITVEAENAARTTAHGNFQDDRNWVDAFQGKDRPLWLKDAGRLRYFEYLPESKTVYVRHSGVQDETDETIAAFFDRVFKFVDENEVSKFILDIRMNGGGNNYLNKSVITGLIAARKINKKGSFFIITGKATFSAAQNLTNELEKYTEAIFVGEPTSENVNFFGDTRTEILPNSRLNVNLSWLWWQNQDPRDKRLWTAPQLAAEMSFDDYQNGKDPAIDLILNYQASDPIEVQVRNLLAEGKEKEALAAVKNYITNPVNRYYKDDVENKINNTGYALMNQSKFKEANQLLGINVEVFPNSPNVYDSYAESFLKLGNRDEAIKYYKIAVSRDPHGVTGESSRAALKQIEERKGF